jgi:hypothetical protein
MAVSTPGIKLCSLRLSSQHYGCRLTCSWLCFRPHWLLAVSRAAASLARSRHSPWDALDVRHTLRQKLCPVLLGRLQHQLVLELRTLAVIFGRRTCRGGLGAAAQRAGAARTDGAAGASKQAVTGAHALERTPAPRTIAQYHNN